MGRVPVPERREFLNLPDFCCALGGRIGSRHKQLRSLGENSGIFTGKKSQAVLKVRFVIVRWIVRPHDTEVRR